MDPLLRRKLVNEVYPRLLYICSSVYCFMFGATMKERQKWMNFVVSYANQASAGTVNQKVLPILIIAFNTATLGDGIWDLDEATKEARIGSELSNFFQEVHVVCIKCYYFLLFDVLSIIILTNSHTFQIVTQMARSTQTSFVNSST
jgi:hypothetical protein